MSASADRTPTPRAGRAASPAAASRTGGLDITHGVVLYLDDITVSFDGFKALNDLSLAIDAGELRCVIGPNGAGKTTMMDVITGKTRPDAGTAFFGQTIDLTRLTEARDRARRASAASSRSRRSSSTTRCSRTSSSRMKADKRVWPTLFARARLGEQRDRIDEIARDRSASPTARTASPGCCRTARSSGSRSACC